MNSNTLLDDSSSSSSSSSSSLIEYDIRQSFDVLDVQQNRTITLDDLQTILLGLGLAKRVDLIELERYLSQDAVGVSAPQAIPLETVLTIIQKRYLSSKSAANVNIFDRAESLRHAFQLVDSQQKGYITAQDLVDLSQSINNDNDNAADDDDNALTEQQAQRIIHYSNHQSQSKGNHNNNKQEEAGYLQPSDFYRLFTPSDP